MSYIHATIILSLVFLAGAATEAPFELNMGIFHLSTFRTEDFNEKDPQYSAFFEVRGGIVEDLSYIYTEDLNFEFSGHFQATLKMKPSKASTLGDIVEVPIQSYITGRTVDSHKVVIDPIKLSEEPQIPLIYKDTLKTYLTTKARPSIENYLKQNLKYAQRRYQGWEEERRKEAESKMNAEGNQEEKPSVAQEL